MYSIKRHIEPIVERRARNSKAILLTGPRQVGNSTLFQHFFKDANQVTFDDLLLAQATDDPGLFLLNNPCPLMIDEVQKCPSIFNRVKIELDKTDVDISPDKHRMHGVLAPPKRHNSTTVTQK